MNPLNKQIFMLCIETKTLKLVLIRDQYPFKSI